MNQARQVNYKRPVSNEWIIKALEQNKDTNQVGHAIDQAKQDWEFSGDLYSEKKREI